MPFINQVDIEIDHIAKAFSLSKDKAFCVWVAMLTMDMDQDDAFDALSVEGPNEKGMDLFWVDHQNQRVFIAQCKYSGSGTHNPKEKDLTNLLSCIDWLASPEALEREGRPELVAAARDYNEALSGGYFTQLWFIYLGSRDENIDKRIRIYNQNPENEKAGRMALHCPIELLESMYEESRGEGLRVKEAKIPIAGQSFEVSGSFGKGLVTSLSASVLIDLYEQHGDQLFARNVRGWLGSRKGTVNAAIIDTVTNEHERSNFWAYNNGITIVCDDYQRLDETGEIVLRNFSIVNGCQTTVALAKANGSSIPDDVFLLARIINPPDSIIDSVIRYTNSQNQIRKWDLISQDATQRRLKKEFDSLDQPIYYAIRRGEWASLSTDQRNKYKSEDGITHTIKHDLLAQYIASYKGNPVIAYKEKGLLFERYYDRTFPVDIRVQEALFIWRVGSIVQELVREEIRKENDRIQRGEEGREKYVLMLKRGGRFFAVAVVGLVANLRNGPDHLRSITEERAVSKGSAERIKKYGKVSIQWYKQAVDDLLQLSVTDLSVLIREADFFSRVRDRITNTYETMSVNEDWLKGALPKLF